MFVFSLLLMPLLYVLKRLLARDRSDEAGFLAAILCGGILALLQGFAGDIFDSSVAGFPAVLNIVIDYTLLPVLLPVLTWFTAVRFFPKSISLSYDQFILLFLIFPGAVRAFQDLGEGWPLYLLIIPALKAALVLSTAWILELKNEARGVFMVFLWVFFGVAFVLAGAAAAAWGLYRPFLALMLALPLFLAAAISLFLDFKNRG